MATLTIDADPVYLEWISAGSSEAVRPVTPPLSLRRLPPVVPGQRVVSAWRVRNDSDQPLAAELTMAVTGTRPLSVEPGSMTVRLNPRSETTVEVAIQAEEGQPLVSLPQWWHVFTGLDGHVDGILKETDLSRIPGSLSSGDQTVAPQRLWVEDGMIDLAEVAGGYREKKPALLFAAVEAPEAMRLPVGAAADWWMRWWVNGKVVYDTLDKGNGGPLTVAQHTFELPLQKGQNVIAVQVLSGSAGFKLAFGGAQAVAVAESGGVHPDRIAATLKSGDRLLAAQTVPLTYQAPLPRFADLDDKAGMAAWVRREAVAVLRETSVENFYEAFPDKAHWYGGTKDLSADLWARDGGDVVDILVAVVDDKQGQARTADRLGDGDGLHLRIGGEEGATPLDVAIGWTGGKARGVPASGAAGVFWRAEHFNQPARHEGYRYVYRIRVSKERLGAGSLVRLEVSDSDGETRKQVARLGTLDDPRSGFRLVVVE